MIPQLFHQLARTLRPGYAAEHSFENYHARGLDYLCLFRTGRMTVKAYFVRRERLADPNGLIVWPHTHRYAFESWVLGEIDHHTYLTERSEFVVRENAKYSPVVVYDYTAEDRALVPVGRSYLREHTETLMSGAYFRLTEDDVHSISLGDSPRAVLLQIQYADTRLTSRLYAGVGAKVECGGEGLYLGVTPSWCAERRDELLDLLNTRP